MPKKIKPKGKKPSKRKVNTREMRDKFLIVCEGKRTEPNYFRKFRVPQDVVEVVGLGYNTVSLVNKAIDLKDKDTYNQVWCVFDKDSFPVENVNKAFNLAKKHNIKTAFSNEAFELWYLLHYHYQDTAMSRALYEKKLTDRLKYKYKKNDPNLYDLLEDKQADAIRNATKLLKNYIPSNPAYNNPCTTVHRLVKALNKVAV